ncbi:MAG: hypothetical protein QCI82_06940 [Candidatus Thermoplasmatota archaeon]|nr:hypothetical protein [Candidatus Thermoplasmatota archaeon]
MRTICISLVLMLGLVLGSVGVSAGNETVSATIEVPPEVSSEAMRSNDTVMVIEGYFTVTRSGPDQLLQLSGALTISQGTWPAEITPSTFSNLVQGERYSFQVNVTVPADSELPGTASYVIELIITNILGSTSFEEAFIVKVDPPAPVDQGDESIIPGFEGGFPWGILIFVIGLLFLIVLCVVWAFRNLELVREIGGGRRIMLREKKSGRILKGRVPPNR